jgi:hypothetical protein
MANSKPIRPRKRLLLAMATICVMAAIVGGLSGLIRAIIDLCRKSR